MTTPEELLRESLHRAVGAAGPPDGLRTAERAVARARTQRRTRTALLGGAVATVLVVGAGTVSIGALTRPGARGADAAGRTTGVHVSASSSGAPVGSGGPPDPGPPSARTGPANPVVGVSYPFDLFTHCGIDRVTFGGREWQAVTPGPEPTPVPGSDGVTVYNGYTAGSMTLVATDLLRFRVPDPRVVYRLAATFDFRPLPESAAPASPCA